MMQDCAGQDSLDLCRKMRPDSELYLAVQAAHAQQVARWEMEADRGAVMEDQATDPLAEEQPKPFEGEAADKGAESVTAATATATSEASALHSSGASHRSRSSDNVLAQLSEEEPELTGPPGIAAAMAGSRSAEGSVSPAPVQSASSSVVGASSSFLLSEEVGAASGGTSSSSSSSSFTRPVPPRQPGAIGSSTARLSRIQIAAAQTLGPAGTSSGPGSGSSSSSKSDALSGVSVVERSSATLRSSAYMYSTPEKSREQVLHAISDLSFSLLF